MMNKNTLTGFVLMALVVFGFAAYENHSRSIQAEEMRIQDSINAVNYAKEVKEEQKKAEKIAEEIADTLNPLFEARTGKAGVTVIENELLKVTLTNLGGQPRPADVGGYRQPHPRHYEGV